MKPTRAVGASLAGAVLLSLFAVGAISLPSDAAKPTQKQAMAACKAQYGKKVVNAIVNKNGSLTCQWRVVREMTRAEVYEACKKKYSATTVSWFARRRTDGYAVTMGAIRRPLIPGI